MEAMTAVTDSTGLVAIAAIRRATQNPIANHVANIDIT
jgi:hypothetical protein